MSDFSEAIGQAPVIFFLGAGASVPLGKPTTSGFWRQLKDDPISPSEAHELLLDLEKSLIEGGLVDVDIEVILDQLLSWEIEAAKLAQHPVSKKLETVQGSLKENIARKAHEAILSRVVDTYGDVSEIDAYGLWGPILEEAWTMGIRTLPIFTTNYDTVIEQAILFSDDTIRMDNFNRDYDYSDNKSPQHNVPKGSFALRDGFDVAHREFARWRDWDFHGYDEDQSKLTVPLFKLHGSVTWNFLDPTETEMPDAEEYLFGLSDEESEVGLLPPGVGRNPLGRSTAIHYPYLTKTLRAHPIFEIPDRYFLTCLLDCKLCVAIGSSFRDKQVVDTLVEAAMFRKCYSYRLAQDGTKQWFKLSDTDLPATGYSKHESADLRIITVAPEPDHLALEKRLRDYPEMPPIEVIPLNDGFSKESVGMIVELLKKSLNE